MPPDALRFEKADRGVDLPLAKRPLVAGSGVDLVSGWHARRHGLGQRRTETNERRPRGDMEGPGLGIATRWCGRGDRDRALDQSAVYRPGKKGPYSAPPSGAGFELVKIPHRRSHAPLPHRFARQWHRWQHENLNKHEKTSARGKGR